MSLGWSPGLAVTKPNPACFQNADIAANSPMNTVDTNDSASGTYSADAGPGMVGGTAFQHLVGTPGEPNPA